MGKFEQISQIFLENQEILHQFEHILGGGVGKKGKLVNLGKFRHIIHGGFS